MKTTRLVVWLSTFALGVGLLAAHAGTAATPSITSEFAAILRSGDLPRLRDVLDRGAPVNGRDSRGNTPLMLSAVYGDTASVKLLIQRGADVNATNLAGATPLLRAAHNHDSVRLLVEHGAEVNARSGLGNTPLILAARLADSHRTVKFLLDHGADATATNNWGASALMAAAAAADDDSVKLLLQHGADANTQPAVDHVGFILGGGRSPLMWSAFRGDLASMKLLLDAGADVASEGFLGSPLAQAAWANQTKAARLLLDRGADVNRKSQGDSYAPLHWAASSELPDISLVELMIKRGANLDIEGGENIEAFMDVPQTPLMLAKRRGDTALVTALTRAGATNETPDEAKSIGEFKRQSAVTLDPVTMRESMSEALVPLQESSIISKQSFVSHASKQDCTSCHQQYLPLAAIGAAKRSQAQVDAELERQLVEIVREGDLKNFEPDWEALFHPDTVYTKGYNLFGLALAGLPADELTDSAVHHLAAIQAADGRWYGNLPRPPMQNGDVSATALAIHALQKYPLPGRKAELDERVERARRWLRRVKPANTDEQAYQLLGLSWAGESAGRLEPLAKRLIAQQRADGGWSQLPTLASDAYATGQSVYALRLAGLTTDHPAVERGQRYLLQTQLADGTWYVRRRAFPFQPTMKSGFPHGKDSWISAAATSWAVLALSLPEEPVEITSGKTTKLANRAQ